MGTLKVKITCHSKGTIEESEFSSYEDIAEHIKKLACDYHEDIFVIENDSLIMQAKFWDFKVDIQGFRPQLFKT